MVTVWTKNTACQELRKNTRHTAGTKRKKCHKCYAYTAPTTIQESDTLLKKSMKNRCLHCIVTATQHSLRFATLHV